MADVPDIIAEEPVYKDSGDEESVIVSCTLEWDEDKGAFINVDSEEGWILDEHRYQQDSSYTVSGESFSSLEEAQKKALENTDLKAEDATVLHQFRIDNI